MNIYLKLFPVITLVLVTACSKPTEQKSESAASNTPETPANAPAINSVTGVVTEI